MVGALIVMDVKRVREPKRKQDEAGQSFGDQPVLPSIGEQPVSPNFGDQPISAFRLFMEEFMKSCESTNGIEMDRKGFETWKNMSDKERQPYVLQAEKVNSAHQEALDKEAKEMIKGSDDEADSSAVGKFDKFSWIYEDDSSECYSSYSQYTSDISQYFYNSPEYSTSQTK